MPWLKTSDTAATHPLLQRARSRTAPAQHVEVFGFVSLCAVQSAAHLTDYFVSEGTAWSVAGIVDGERLARLAVRAGMMKPAKVDGIRGWLIVDDADFLHVRLAKEVLWERQRKADGRNNNLLWPARVRDGDACRYCGVVVNWGDRRGGRGGTMDHRKPKEAATVDDYVVSCKSCNSSRGDDPHADERHPLLPPPAHPIYSETTIALLAKHGFDVTPSTAARPDSQSATAPARPRTERDTAPLRDPAPSGTPRPPVSRPPIETGPDPDPDPRADGPGLSGTGRVRVGTGRDGTVASARSRRARRGRSR